MEQEILSTAKDLGPYGAILFLIIIWIIKESLASKKDTCKVDIPDMKEQLKRNAIEIEQRVTFQHMETHFLRKDIFDQAMGQLKEDIMEIKSDLKDILRRMKN